MIKQGTRVLTNEAVFRDGDGRAHVVIILQTGLPSPVAIYIIEITPNGQTSQLIKGMRLKEE